MRCFFTNGKPAVRDNPRAELCATGKHHCQLFFSWGERGNLLTPTVKATALLSGSAAPGRQQHRGPDYHCSDRDHSLGALKHLQIPFHSMQFLVAFCRFFLFFHTSFNLPQGFIQRCPTCRHNFLLQRIPQTPSTQHQWRSFLKILHSLPELLDFTQRRHSSWPRCHLLLARGRGSLVWPRAPDRGAETQIKLLKQSWCPQPSHPLLFATCTMAHSSLTCRILLAPKSTVDIYPDPLKN